jgi:hypothetical protein
MNSLQLEILRAHEEVKRGTPGARRKLEKLQARYRAGGAEIIRDYYAEGAVQLTEAGAKPTALRRIERGSSATRPTTSRRAPRRSTRTSQRPYWLLGEDEPWRLR